MELARPGMASMVAAAWAAQPPQVQAGIAFVQTVATKFRTLLGSPAIRRLAQNAGRQ